MDPSPGTAPHPPYEPLSAARLISRILLLDAGSPEAGQLARMVAGALGLPDRRPSAHERSMRPRRARR